MDGSFTAVPALLRLPRVIERVGLGRSSIYAMAKRGEFPKPISLGGRAVAWREDEVSAWIAERIAAATARQEEVAHG